ncbi:hypothetical protein H920_00636 [Fukomys damarensis]|uniref:Uncharacterized protein n=1 Tax=Fukomys damarensis TaxID=885580 RepID=A0A091EQK3_FUKDA|nr:hypothetical protein H920_00636 [Fukomys damarensis]
MGRFHSRLAPEKAKLIAVLLLWALPAGPHSTARVRGFSDSLPRKQQGGWGRTKWEGGTWHKGHQGATGRGAHGFWASDYTPGNTRERPLRQESLGQMSEQEEAGCASSELQLWAAGSHEAQQWGQEALEDSKGLAGSSEERVRVFVGFECHTIPCARAAQLSAACKPAHKPVKIPTSKKMPLNRISLLQKGAVVTRIKRKKELHRMEP